MPRDRELLQVRASDGSWVTDAKVGALPGFQTHVPSFLSRNFTGPAPNNSSLGRGLFFSGETQADSLLSGINKVFS